MKGIEANKVLQTERGRLLSEQMRLVAMSKSISAVVLVAVLLGLSGSVQAGGPRYDDYYYGGGYYGGYYPNYSPRPPLPPVPVRQVPIPPPPPYGHQSTDGCLFPLRLLRVAVNTTTGLGTTVLTHAIRLPTLGQGGEGTFRAVS